MDPQGTEEGMEDGNENDELMEEEGTEDPQNGTTEEGNNAGTEEGAEEPKE
jgi:hypothetical protein